MVKSFGFTLDITAMITILQEIIKTLYEKMSKVINFYWFHNDGAEKYNSFTK